MTTEIVKMSSKGQLVVPQDIRNMEGLKAGDRFIPFPIKEGVIFRRINIPNIKTEFKNLSTEIEKQFKKQKITAKDVSEAVKWARKK
ncbi:AbrB/MazE/SpoVT family DNA-binding domain-containing protein [Candidatus Woesearchaeota archaeon]|nr:AbrB/MazE/SpoVT family DNA-binding domain-containing protein [Candidatus Woesearchaeota archaeon]